MKMTLTLLIAGLIFLATPMLASAEGRRESKDHRYHKESVKYDRYEKNSYFNRHDYRYNQRHRHPARNNQMKQFRHVPSKPQQVLRKSRQKHQRPNNLHAYHTVAKQPAIIVGLPHILFKLGW